MSDESIVVRTIKELVELILKGAVIIEIEGDLVNKVVRIKATGSAAWIVAIGAVGVAVLAVTAAPAAAVVPPAEAGVAAFAAAGAAPAAAILGMPAAIVAVSMAVAGGGVGVLNKLRKYEIVEKSDSRLVLRKK